MHEAIGVVPVLGSDGFRVGKGSLPGVCHCNSCNREENSFKCVVITQLFEICDPE